MKITNTGKMDGEEVAQLYIKHLNVNGKTPLKALKGFQRVFLKAGESKTLEFRLESFDLAQVDEKGELIARKGKLLISVGGGQPGVTNKTSSNVLSKVLLIK